MTVKELFKMVEKSNELKKLLNEKEIIIEVTFNNYYNYKIKNYNEYKKTVKEEINKEFIQEYLNPELIQENKYKNYFTANNLQIVLDY